MKLPPFLCPLGYDRNGGFYMKYTLKEKLRFVKLHIEENVPIYEIDKVINEFSNTQLYKMAGNGIVVDVLENVFKAHNYL